MPDKSKVSNIITEKNQNNEIGSAESYVQTDYEYDSRNRVLAVRQNKGANGIYTQYKYDNKGNVLKYVHGQTEKLTDLNGELPDNATYVTYQYDRFGNVISETDAMGNTKTAVYNYFGSPTTETDKNGTVFTKTYDGYGNLKTYESGNDLEMMYSYTLYNQPLSCWDVNSNNVCGTAYDSLGYIKTEAGMNPWNRRLYENDVNGNRTNMQARIKVGSEYVDTFVDYTYDILDRLTSVSFNDGEATVSYTYDDNSNLVSQTVNGVVTEYMYNQAGLMTSQSTEGEKSYAMEYNLRGLKTKETDSNGGEKTYTYDVLGQLTQELRETNSLISGIYSYSYDTKGNRISNTIVDVNDNYESTTNYTYDRNNKLTRQTSTYGQTDTIFDYTYDNNGNMVSRLTSVISPETEENPTLSIETVSSASADTIEGAEAVFYTYNKLNQLISVEADNGMTASYEYDAMGRRNLKNVNGTETYMYSDGANVISEVISGTEETASTINHYYRGKTLVASNTSGTLNRYSYDPHGSVTAINGVEVYSYDAFGNQIADNPAYVNPFRYCGEYCDAETGLIYLRARYYDPSTGRFISEDPIKDGVNWYAYCGNDPVNFVDPLGYLRGPGYNNKGEWSENPDADDYGYGSAKYNMLVSLGNIWENVDDLTKVAIADIANNLRNTEVGNINRVMLLNDENGAGGNGHMAVLLLNENDKGFLFSYYSTVENPLSTFGVRGEMCFRVLGTEEWNSLLYD